MKDAITYANEAGFFEFNVLGWKTEFERLIEAVRTDALAELATVKESLTAQDHIRGATKMVKRPQNCGTGFCSCIECVVKPDHIAHVRKMVPDHFADAGNKVSDHIAASGKVILTEEQAQQIEEALDELRYANNTDIAKAKYYKALATIRAARAQEQAEQEPDIISKSLRRIQSLERQLKIAQQQWDNSREYALELAERLFKYEEGSPMLLNSEQAEQEPVPTGATHYQPHQKTYYKRVSATEWYLWSCTGKGWLPSKGTSDSSEWIMLSPIQAHQPAKPAEQEPVAWLYDWEYEGEVVTGWVTQDFETTKFNNGHNIRPLYAAPVRTKDLTEQEIQDAIINISPTGTGYFLRIARAVIAADRENNRG